VGGPTARISRGCCAWSRAPWTTLNRSTHAAEACWGNHVTASLPGQLAWH
jgi:hypothetical protein